MKPLDVLLRQVDLVFLTVDRVVDGLCRFGSVEVICEYDTLCHGFLPASQVAAAEYKPKIPKRNTLAVGFGYAVCYWWPVFPVPRLTADTAGRRSCQGWPEATAE